MHIFIIYFSITLITRVITLSFPPSVEKGLQQKETCDKNNQSIQSENKIE